MVRLTGELQLTVAITSCRFRKYPESLSLSCSTKRMEGCQHQTIISQCKTLKHTHKHAFLVSLSAQARIQFEDISCTSEYTHAVTVPRVYTLDSDDNYIRTRDTLQTTWNVICTLWHQKVEARQRVCAVRAALCIAVDTTHNCKLCLAVER